MKRKKGHPVYVNDVYCKSMSMAAEFVENLIGKKVSEASIWKILNGKQNTIPGLSILEATVWTPGKGSRKGTPGLLLTAENALKQSELLRSCSQKKKSKKKEEDFITNENEVDLNVEEEMKIDIQARRKPLLRKRIENGAFVQQWR